MSRNSLVNAATDVVNAINALRIKHSHRLLSTGEGVVIRQPGKPDLLLTFEAARRWAQEMEDV